MKKIFYVILVLLFIVIAGVLGFFYYKGLVFSTQILSLEITGPKTAKVGDQIEYTIKYKNSGNFVLEKPKISLYLPEDSLNEDSKTRFEKELDNLDPGSDGSITFSNIVLLGKEGEDKVATASFSYAPHNLSARYEAEAKFTTKIEEVPIDLSFNIPNSIEQGKETNFYINYLSNIAYPLENLSFKLDLIENFTIKSATPPSLDNIEWKIGTLNKGNGGQIQINGTTSSKPQSKILFSGHLGMWQGSNFIIIKEINKEVTVTPSTNSIPETTNTSSNN